MIILDTTGDVPESARESVLAQVAPPSPRRIKPLEPYEFYERIAVGINVLRDDKQVRLNGSRIRRWITFGVNEAGTYAPTVDTSAPRFCPSCLKLVPPDKGALAGAGDAGAVRLLLDLVDARRV